MKPRIFVLYTGGTIGMVSATPDTGAFTALVPQTQVPWQHYLPPAVMQQVELSFANLPSIIDSADAEPQHWATIAQHIAQVYAEFDGFVVLHGTDTLAYTASALAFMLVNLNKPVVCTGSQLPISHPQSDAVYNLIQAIRVAADPPALPEVFLVFHQRVLRGCRSRKLSSTALDAFDSPNYPAFSLLDRADSVRLPPLVLQDQMVPVLDISCYPGLNWQSWAHCAATFPPIQGIVLRGYGSGNLPQRAMAVIGHWLAAGVVVVMVSQCWQAQVNLATYQTSAHYAAAGVVSGMDMTPEAALTKLSWLLAYYPPAQVKTLMVTNLRGELSMGQSLASQKCQR